MTNESKDRQALRALVAAVASMPRQRETWDALMHGKEALCQPDPCAALLAFIKRCAENRDEWVPGFLQEEARAALAAYEGGK